MTTMTACVRCVGWLLSACLVAAAGCGDAFVDGAYRGEALFVIEGWVRLDPSATPPRAADDGSGEAGRPPGDPAGQGPGPLRLALFWAPAKGSGFHFEGAVEQNVATDGLFPARFRLALFAPPEDDIVRPVAGGQGELAVALMLAYLDDDRDQRWDRDVEPIVGGAPERLLLYTPDGVKSPLYGELGPGFHRLVPFKACVMGPDGVFETRYQQDMVADVDLIVSLAFPVEVFFDADCDGNPNEWGGVCPPLAKVRTMCRESGPVTPQDAELCDACLPLLPPPAAPGDVCDAWLGECLHRSPPDECEAEWRLCYGEGPIVDPACVELDCVCQRVHEECLASFVEPEVCDRKMQDCMMR